MKNKIQKWYRLGHDEPWQPMYDDVIYSLPSINVQYYWTPMGKHPVEIMKLEEEINGRSKQI